MFFRYFTFDNKKGNVHSFCRVHWTVSIHRLFTVSLPNFVRTSTTSGTWIGVVVRRETEWSIGSFICCHYSIYLSYSIYFSECVTRFSYETSFPSRVAWSVLFLGNVSLIVHRFEGFTPTPSWTTQNLEFQRRRLQVVKLERDVSHLTQGDDNCKQNTYSIRKRKILIINLVTSD